MSCGVHPRQHFDNLIDQHPALGSGTVDFIFHRFLAAALPSYLDYLRETVFPLLRPGGQVEMHDVTGAQFYHSELKVAGSATCVSRYWYWFSVYKEAMQRRGAADRFDTISTSLQIVGFEDVGQRLFQLPWGPIPEYPETDRWAAYGPRGIADSSLVGVPKGMGEGGMRNVDAATFEKSVRETTGRSSEGLWMPFLMAWGRKPS